jgi:hypothetical protein
LKEKAPFSSNTYVICPNQVYYIGYQYGVGNCCVDGDYPLVSRANTHFKCGEDGSRANNCTLVAGSTHVVYNEFVFDEELGGVVVEGFTFDSPQLMTSTLVGSGDIKFVDCVAKVRSPFPHVVAAARELSALCVRSPHSFVLRLRSESKERGAVPCKLRS